MVRNCGLGSCLAGGSSFFLRVFLLLYLFFFFCFSFFGLLVLCSLIVFLLPSSLFLILSKCSPFCLLVFFFKIFLSPKPLYFSTLKKTYVRLFFPQTISSSLSLFVSIFRSFLSSFSLFPLKKISFFFSFWISLCIYKRQGKRVTLPCPSTG